MFEEIKFNKPKLTPEEQKAHEESERRRKILDKERGEEIRKETSAGLAENLTVEEEKELLESLDEENDDSAEK